MGLLSNVKHFYETKYRVLLILTLFMIPAAFGVLLYEKSVTGDYFHKGISLKGGDSYTFPVTQAVDLQTLQQTLAQVHPNADMTVRGVSEFGKLSALIVEVSDLNESALIASLNNAGIQVTPGNYSKESIGASLGEAFFKQTIIALIAAFVLMAIVVFITFRSILPSSFVILAVVSTTLETLAVVSLLQIPLSTAGIAAFLMLIGYSVDTDILLTNRALSRKEGTLLSRIYSAMKTGMTMTLTAIVTTGIAYVFSDSDVIKQIMLILTIGLLFDMINTWVQNVGILRWHFARKEHHE